jgi:hypothetical protein
MDSLPLSFGKVAPKLVDQSRIASTQRTDNVRFCYSPCIPVVLTTSIRQAPTIRLGDPLPNQDEEDNDYSEFDQSESGPSSTRNLPHSTDDNRGVVEYDDEDEDDEESMLIRQEGDDLPVSHEIVMKDHTKVDHPVHLFQFVTGTDPRSPEYDRLYPLYRSIHLELEWCQGHMIMMLNYGILVE